MHKDWLKRSVSFTMYSLCVSEKFQGVNILEAQKSRKVEQPNDLSQVTNIE